MSSKPPFDTLDAQRLDNLEIQMSFAEDLLETLNLTIARQAEQIEALSREVLKLREQQQKPQDSVSTATPGNSHDAPPHY
ncbi:MAG: SlyX family protein [Burkholderiaceae bacterium]